MQLINPYYHLTKKGILVRLAINGIEDMESQLKEFFDQSEPEEKEFEKILIKFMTKLSLLTELSLPAIGVKFLIGHLLNPAIQDLMLHWILVV